MGISKNFHFLRIANLKLMEQNKFLMQRRMPKSRKNEKFVFRFTRYAWGESKKKKKKFLGFISFLLFCILIYKYVRG